METLAPPCGQNKKTCFMGVPPMKHRKDARATPLRLCASALNEPEP
jgi:hypothetical protein